METRITPRFDCALDLQAQGPARRGGAHNPITGSWGFYRRAWRQVKRPDRGRLKPIDAKKEVPLNGRNPGKTKRMAKVTGIGGFFFRASDPEALGRWYLENLGISLVPSDYGVKPWTQEGGPTVFAPFPKESDYFGNAQKNWMINFRVGNLDELVAELRGRKIEVTVDGEVYPNGRFARLKDPEGNPIELWEPK